MADFRMTNTPSGARNVANQETTLIHNRWEEGEVTNPRNTTPKLTRESVSNGENEMAKIVTPI